MNRPVVLRMQVNALAINSAVELINRWVHDGTSRYVCVSNVHMCMEVFDDPEFERVVNSSDLTVPDGKPIHWVVKALGFSHAEQIRGEDLSHAVIADAEKHGYSVGFFGSSQPVLNELKSNLMKAYPGLKIALLLSPPFGDIQPEIDEDHIRRINESGISVLFVGLGCPKQERWMHDHKDKLGCTMIGVGAVFDFVAKTKRSAPKWMQKAGLEWAFRLWSEPGRLWYRYLKHNPRFAIYALWQILFRRSGFYA